MTKSVVLMIVDADLDLCTCHKLAILKSCVERVEESKNQRSFASGNS